MLLSKVFFELSNCLEPQLRTVISFKPGSFVFFTPFRVSGAPEEPLPAENPSIPFPAFWNRYVFGRSPSNPRAACPTRFLHVSATLPAAHCASLCRKPSFHFQHSGMSFLTFVYRPIPPFQDEAYRPSFPTQGFLAPTTAQLPQESANLSKSSCPVFQFSGMPFLILSPAAPPFLDESIDRTLCSRGLRSSPSLIPRKEWCCRNPLSDFLIYWNAFPLTASIRLIS